MSIIKEFAGLLEQRRLLGFPYCLHKSHFEDSRKANESHSQSRQEFSIYRVSDFSKNQ